KQITEKLTTERDDALTKHEQALQQHNNAADPAPVEQNALNQQAEETISSQEKELETLSKQLSELNKELDHSRREADVQRDNAFKAQEQLDAMQKAQQTADIDDSQDVQATLEQL